MTAPTSSPPPQPTPQDLPVVVLDAGMGEVSAAKQAHFEAFSGQPRSRRDLDVITDAAYRMRENYEDAEDLFRLWAYAPVPADRAARYLLAEMTTDEALDHWEQRFATDPDGAAVALDLMVGLRMPPHARQRAVWSEHH